jgi:hypothetical protein
MSKAHGSKDLSETFQDFLTACSKALFVGGALATLACAGLLIFTCFRVSGDPTVAKAALSNIDVFRRVLMVATVCLGIGAGYLFWGEDVVSGILVLCSGGLYFAPAIVPNFLPPGTGGGDAVGAALGAVQMGGIILGVLSLVSLVSQIAIKVSQRARIGVKSDQLKYGKGVKEEADRQNVFMGNCWQLPYCRKFVRERCPIFHARRTCWREKVGCMCEEEVIRNAMENKPIPKDALLASKMIPKNFRLTEQQKIERCKTCVIYNEHQRHKYRLVLPAVIISFIVAYAGLHGVLIGLTQGTVEKIYQVVNVATMTHGSGPPQVPGVFVEGLLFVFALVTLSYTLKVVEFCIFKIKI